MITLVNKIVKWIIKASFRKRAEIFACLCPKHTILVNSLLINNRCRNRGGAGIPFPPPVFMAENPLFWSLSEYFEFCRYKISNTVTYCTETKQKLIFRRKILTFSARFARLFIHYCISYFCMSPTWVSSLSRPWISYILMNQMNQDKDNIFINKILRRV